MGVFDSSADSPFQIRTEGQEIDLNFTRTSPTTARISWNIPTPSAGCTSDTQAYDGILITIDNTPITLAKSPVDGTVYTADPTADRNLHAGDKIGSSLVVAAFYNEKVGGFPHTILDITGLEEGVPYYVSGFAVDSVYRYHTEGVHAYSLPYTQDHGTPDTAGSQEIILGADGVLGTDSTGLTAGVDYTFTINIDGIDYPITVNGTDAATYDDLTAAIKTQLDAGFVAANSISSGPTPPNTGTLFWDSAYQRLLKWTYDSSTHRSYNTQVTTAVEAVNPTTLPLVGTYWYDTSLPTPILKLWDGAVWGTPNVISYLQDPTSLEGDDYWYNGTNAYMWDGNIWCEQTLYSQTTDPILPTYPVFGSYWYDTTTQFLYKWNDQTHSWNEESAIYWSEDPLNPSLNAYWFDETANTLKKWSGAGWATLTATISTTEPVTTSANQYWYDPDTEVLKQRDPTNTFWTILEVLAWPTDPTATIGSCDLWWDSGVDKLYTWDTVTSAWVEVVHFYQQTNDPAAAPTLTTDSVWYNTTTNTLSKWNGSGWEQVTFINYSVGDPMLPAINDVWMDTTNDLWYNWNGASWDTIAPYSFGIDLNAPTANDCWFDTNTNTLYQGNGVGWTSISYTTTSPAPTTGTYWIDSGDGTLYEWNGSKWVEASYAAVVELNTAGNLLFTSLLLGGQSYIGLTDGTLFASLSPTATLGDIVLGVDGVDNIPSYAKSGIGDDGTSDERRELMDSIRQQLGYPVVNVELTKYQMDTAITSALEALRKRSSAAYKRGFFFLDVQRGTQSYILADRASGFNKIVNVMGAYRMTSAFLSTAYGSGVYGQVVLQHLYNMGTFDLLSYHLVSQYIEQLEHLFASRLTFTWDEQQRRLNIYDTFAVTEKILLDVTIERTENDLLTDRWTKSWIEKYAQCTARIMLSEIRGKYATLPGAGGGVSLNAADLITKAEADMAELLSQLDDYIVNPVEDFGNCEFTIG